MAMAQGFGAPTRGGGFGESLSNALGGVSAVQKDRRGIETDLAKMKLDLGARELEQDKESMLSSAIMGQIGGQGGQGAPGGQGGMSLSPQARQMLGTLAVLDPKSAIKTLIEFQRDESKRPDALKALDTYITSLPPEQQAGAREFAARSNIYGKPTDVSESVIKIRQAIRNGDMSPEQGESEIARISGGRPAAPASAQAPAVTRLTSPNEQEARSIAESLDASGVPFSVGVAPGASGAAQPPARPAVPGMSPRASEEVAVAGAKTRIEGEEKSRADDRNDLKSTASRASQMKIDADTIFDLAEKNPNAFGIFSKPGIGNAFLTAAENGVRVGNFSVGLNDLQSVVLRAGGTQKDIDAVSMLLQTAVRTQLDLAAGAKGSVSNFERELFGQASFMKSDSPTVLKYKAELARAHGEFYPFLWEKFKAQEKATNSSFEDYKLTDEYKNYKKQYEKTLEKIRGAYIR
jgi:hypothetical protein